MKDKEEKKKLKWFTESLWLYNKEIPDRTDTTKEFKGNKVTSIKDTISGLSAQHEREMAIANKTKSGYSQTSVMWAQLGVIKVWHFCKLW